jgi:hypothetical protein
MFNMGTVWNFSSKSMDYANFNFIYSLLKRRILQNEANGDGGGVTKCQKCVEGLFFKTRKAI